MAVRISDFVMVLKVKAEDTSWDVASTSLSRPSESRPSAVSLGAASNTTIKTTTTAKCSSGELSRRRIGVRTILITAYPPGSLVWLDVPIYPQMTTCGKYGMSAARRSSRQRHTRQLAQFGDQP